MIQKIRTLIIEDEAPARTLLRKFLEGFEEIDVIGECADGFSGLKVINETQPDLIFLDIQMPKLTGFELLELLENLPEVVFTTAYDEYAIKAFDLNAVDYLMKPFSKQRLRQAVDKVIERFKLRLSAKPKIEKLIEHVHAKNKSLERVVVKSGSKIHIIPVDQIEHIEAQDDYVFIYSPEGRFLKKETMQSIEQNLPAEQFIRVHRSHIVNIRQIQRLEQYGKENYLLILKNGNQVGVSKSRIKDLKKELNF